MKAIQLIKGHKRLSMDAVSFVANASASRFQHETTVVVRSNESDSGHEGATMWVVSIDQETVALAWDWFELSDGVFALADPVAITSTLELYDRLGQRLSFREYVVTVNELVNGINWQDRVRLDVESRAASVIGYRSSARKQGAVSFAGQRRSSALCSVKNLGAHH